MQPQEKLTRIYSALRYRGIVTSRRDFARYSFSTIASELGWTDDVIGLCLGHAKKGVTSVYIRANHQPQVDACVRAVREAVYGN